MNPPDHSRNILFMMFHACQTDIHADLPVLIWGRVHMELKRLVILLCGSRWREQGNSRARSIFSVSRFRFVAHHPGAFWAASSLRSGEKFPSKEWIK